MRLPERGMDVLAMQETGSCNVAKQNSRLDVLFGIEVGQKDDGLEHCFVFQGQFFHFRPIHRNGEIEDNLPDPVAIRLHNSIRSINACINSFRSTSEAAS